jgi:hypothetical protein
MKQCPQCKKEKPESEYGKDSKRVDGLKCWCKECCSRKNKQYYHNTLKHKTYNREIPSEKKCSKCGEIKPSSDYRSEKRNRDGLYSCCRECTNKRQRELYQLEENRQRYREIAKQSYYRNHDKNKARFKRWYEENKDKNKINSRKWREGNREKDRFMAMRWVTNNPEKAATIRRNRIARLKGAEGSHTAEEIAKLLKKQNGLCTGCKKDIKTSYTVDHIVPLIRGGSNRIENIQLMCKSCNCSKGAKDMQEFLEYRGRLR